MVDRVGLTGWRRLLEGQANVQPARVRPSVVHLIARSSRFSGIDDARAISKAPACWLRLVGRRRLLER